MKTVPMNEFLKMDIFFVIASTATVIFAVGLGICGYYAVRILRNVERISELLLLESEKISGDIDHVRAKIKGGEMRIERLVMGAVKFVGAHLGARPFRKSRKTERDQDN